MNFRLLNLKLWLLRAPIYLGSVLCFVSICLGQSTQDQYRLAAGHYERGQWSEAYDAFDELSATVPNSPEGSSSAFFAAEALMQMHQFKAGLQKFHRFLELYPESEFAPRAKFRLGEAAYRLDKYDTAVRLLEEFVANYPKHELNEFALPYLGQIRLAQHEPQLAQRAFETALRDFPQSSLSNRVRLGLAKSLQRQGQTDSALRFFEFLTGQNDPRILAETQLQLGKIYFSSGQLEAAKKEFNSCLSSTIPIAVSTEATYWLARIAADEDDLRTAFELLQSVVDNAHQSELAEEILFDSAILSFRSGQSKFAKQCLTTLRQEYPDCKLVERGRDLEIEILTAEGSFQRAIQEISEIADRLDVGPRWQQLIESKGNLQYQSGEFEQAKLTYQKLIDQSSNPTRKQVSEWAFQKGISEIALGHFQQAVQSLSLCAKQEMSAERAWAFELATAAAVYGLRDFPVAKTAYERIIADSKVPVPVNAYCRLIICYAETAGWYKGLEFIQSAAKKFGDREDLIQSIGYFYCRSIEEGAVESMAVLDSILSDSKFKTDYRLQGAISLAKLFIRDQDFNSLNRFLLKSDFPESERAKINDLLFSLANSAQKSKQWNKATELLSSVELGRSKTDQKQKARQLQSKLLLQMGGEENLLRAKSILLTDLPIVTDPDRTQSLYQLAWIFHDLGEIETSIQYFQQLVDEFPNTKLAGDASYRIVQHHVRSNRLVIAEQGLMKALTNKKLTSELKSRLLFLSGQIESRRKNWTKVALQMNQVIQLTKDSALSVQAKYWLGESHFQLKEYSLAAPLLAEIVDQDSELPQSLHPWGYLRYSQILGYQNQWPKAKKVAEKGKSESENFALAYEFDFVIGRAIEDSGKLTDARKVYLNLANDDTAKNSETAANALWRAGETYFHQNKFRDAIRTYQEVDSLYSYPHWRSAALLQAGKCQEKLASPKRAVLLYKNLLKRFPESEFASEAKLRIGHLTNNPVENVGQNEGTAKPTRR
ncbi:MAG: tetratricopeptide repeat protein [Planctomycetota bacterium]